MSRTDNDRMNRHPIIHVVSLAFLCLLLPVRSNAQTEVPHTFEAGQPARAAEVNENFDALEAAVDSNSAAIEANAATLQQNADAIATLSQGDAIVLDFSDPENCVITESGNYVLDRPWSRAGSRNRYGNFACKHLGDLGEIEYFIRIDAPQVVFDMRGFSISGYEMCDYCKAIWITSGNVTIRNGYVGAGVVANAEAQVRLENFTGRASLGSNATVLGSTFYSNAELVGLTVGSDSLVESSWIHGYTYSGEGPHAFGAGGNNVVIRNNTFIEGVPLVLGNLESSMVINNRFRLSARRGIELAGNNNIMRDNVVLSTATGTALGTAIKIDGYGNIVDGNIVKQWGNGIVFHQPGNFYGDNRVSATVPYSGTAGQTDWGGNVSF